MQGPRLLFFSAPPLFFSFLAMRYKAQGFPKGGALYLIAEKKRRGGAEKVANPPLESLERADPPTLKGRGPAL
jgi:hypothetical protein